MKVKYFQKSITELNVSNECAHLHEPHPQGNENKLLKQIEEGKKQLRTLKNSIKNMKEEITLCIRVLRKELGDDVDLLAMIKSGYGPGNIARKQELTILKIRLTAMKSKFLDPSHKLYYRGPLDPKKKFDLKCLPQKEETLFDQVLADDKLVYLKERKSADELKAEIKNLNLMYRASVLRTKSLHEKIHAAEGDLEALKSKGQTNSRMVEFMINHQNLMKLMLNPKTLELDPELKSCLEPKGEEVSDVYKFKTLYETAQTEIDNFSEKITSLAEALDETNRNLLESQKLGFWNQYQMAALTNADFGGKKSSKGKSGKTKKNDDKESIDSQLAHLIEENKQLRDFLTSPVLSNIADFKVFEVTLKNTTLAFEIEFEQLRNEYKT